MNDYKKVFKVFKQNHKLIPLEIFADNPYKSLIATMMSSRTNDDTTAVAAKRLFEKAPNVSSLAKLSENNINKLIYPVGFHKTKAKQLKKIASLIQKDFDNKIPKTREELMTLPGVGRKTANLVLNRAFGIPAIAVDTHVHRICNILGWVNTKTPEQTEKELLSGLPKKAWSKVNILFVGVGRQYRSERQMREFLTKNDLI